MYNVNMEQPEFHKFLFDCFLEWEKKQPKRRSSYSAFARWLSDNSKSEKFSQQVVTDWINGKYEPSEKFIPILADKLGLEIYDSLGQPRPDPKFQEYQQLYNQAPDKEALLTAIVDWLEKNGVTVHRPK